MWLLEDESNNSVVQRIVDQDKMMCSDDKYRRRPVLPILRLLKVIPFNLFISYYTNCKIIRQNKGKLLPEIEEISVGKA